MINGVSVFLRVTNNEIYVCIYIYIYISMCGKLNQVDISTILSLKGVWNKCAAQAPGFLVRKVLGFRTKLCDVKKSQEFSKSKLYLDASKYIKISFGNQIWHQDSKRLQ